jgi:TolB protein
VKKSLLLALLIAGLTAGTAQAAFPGENGKIAFARFTTGTSADILTADPEGSGIQNLTNSPDVDDRYPAWSGDGAKLVFMSTSSYFIYSMRADGSNKVSLLRGGDPSISADGTQVAYGGTARFFPESNEEIFAMNADGSNVRNLIDDPLGPEWPDDRSAVWSPDGQQLAFVRDEGSFYAIWTVNADGTVFTPLIGPAVHPDWSPDGEHLVFESRGDIYVSDADGYNPRFLTGSVEGDSYPVWSPDGTTVAFQRYRGSGNAHDIWLIDADGSNERLAIANALEPDWQPVSNRPPQCSGLVADPSVFPRPERRVGTVRIGGAVDPDGDPVEVRITGVTQDEPVTGPGDHTRPDARLRSDNAVRVRVERSPRGDGRVYRIAATVTDSRGGTCTGTAIVAVPRHGGRPAVDSAPPSYDSLAHSARP